MNMNLGILNQLSEPQPSGSDFLFALAQFPQDSASGAFFSLRLGGLGTVGAENVSSPHCRDASTFAIPASPIFVRADERTGSQSGRGAERASFKMSFIKTPPFELRAQALLNKDLC